MNWTRNVVKFYTNGTITSEQLTAARDAVAEAEQAALQAMFPDLLINVVVAKEGKRGTEHTAAYVPADPEMRALVNAKPPRRDY